MKPDPRTVFQDALAELKAKPKKGRKAGPNRFIVRDLLCALGELVLDEGEAALRPQARELRALMETDEKAWERAIDEELELACNEHIQGADPKFLDHPRYDFVYAVAARRRLEQRFRALEVLGRSVPERLLDRVAEADARFEPYLKDEQR